MNLKKKKRNKMINLEECSHCNTTTRGVFTLNQTFASKTQRTSTMFFEKKKILSSFSHSFLNNLEEVK